MQRALFFLPSVARRGVHPGVGFTGCVPLVGTDSAHIVMCRCLPGCDYTERVKGAGVVTVNRAFAQVLASREVQQRKTVAEVLSAVLSAMAWPEDAGNQRVRTHRLHLTEEQVRVAAVQRLPVVVTAAQSSTVGVFCWLQRCFPCWYPAD